MNASEAFNISLLWEDQEIFLDIFNTSLYDQGDNQTKSEEESVPYTYRPETYIVPAVFFIIFVTGAVGNGALIFMFARYRQLRNVPNTYIVSLAMGDLLVIVFSVPFVSTIYTVESWPWGEVVCRASEFVRDLSIGVSVFTLTALSADRYLAIVRPLSHHVSGSSARITLVATATVWLIAFVLALPAAVLSHVKSFPFGKEVILVCYPFPEEFGDQYPRIHKLTQFLAYYAFPLAIIATFYALMARHLIRSARLLPGEATGQGHQIQARKKVAKMVLSFVVIFALCFLPNNIFNMWFHFHPTARDDYNYFWNVFRMVGFCLGFANSCINPLALYFVSSTFRKYYRRHVLCWCQGKGRGTRGGRGHGPGGVGGGWEGADSTASRAITTTGKTDHMTLHSITAAPEMTSTLCATNNAHSFV